MSNALEFDSSLEKQAVFDGIGQYLGGLSIQIAETDFDRPWGGFFVVDEASTEHFINQFFPGHSYEEIANGLSLTPKILVAEPGKRLSWQYHYRREEIWSILSGPVGVIISENDEQGPVRTVDPGEVVSFSSEVRHRLIGLERYGVVAEFWKHTDPNNPSDESDIVRVQDDFARN